MPAKKVTFQGQELSRKLCWLAGINIYLKPFDLTKTLWAPVLQLKGVAVLLQQTQGRQWGKEVTANLQAILLRKRHRNRFTAMTLKLKVLV